LARARRAVPDVGAGLTGDHDAPMLTLAVSDTVLLAAGALERAAFRRFVGGSVRHVRVG
jgi:hypothetical protein